MGRDEDDWVGTPPEGHHGPEKADPAFWARQWKAQAIVFGILFILVAIVLVLALT